MTANKKRTPLYSQIRDYVLANIQQQHWQANDQLPTEMELAEKFNVSRFTVKKALVELVEEGLIFRIQGKGSFVASAVSQQLDNPFYPTEPVSVPQKQIVFLIPHIQSSLSSNILAGAEDYLSNHNCQLIVKSSRNEQEWERRVLLDSVSTGIEGILIFPVDGETYNEDILRLTLNKFPVVVIDRYLKGVETNCVCSDNTGGAFEATSHLIGLGHKHIAFAAIHSKPTTSLEERLSGYERALADHHLPIGPRLSHYGYVEDPSDEFDELGSMSSIIRDFLKREPAVTAVFAATTKSGLATMQAAASLGLKIPEQLSVIFFDDFEFASLSRIPPTCILQNETALGMEAAKLLLSVIDNPLQERRKITLPTRLLLRQSTSVPPNSTT